MANKKGKLPAIKGIDDPMGMVLRQVDATNPKRAVIATETPVMRYDDSRGEVVAEVLLMDGVEFRGGRNQIPIVDSHDDTTVRNILGSVRGIAVDDAAGELYGVPSFASDEEAKTIENRMNEGHITDFSITALPLESVYIPLGRSYTTPRGAVIDGPAIIHKRWEPHNASICATGADVNSTVRRSYAEVSTKERKVIRMDESLLSQLSGMGMPEGMTDPNQILAWVVGKMGSAAVAQPVVESMAGEMATEVETEEVENMSGEETKEEAPVERSAADVAELVKRALANDQKRRKAIQDACKLAKVERSFADELCDEGVSVADANARIIQKIATQPIGRSAVDIQVTESGDDKFYQAIKDGLLMRTQTSSRISKSIVEKPAAGANEFRHMSMVRMAEEVLRRAGVATHRFSAPEIARAAVGNQAVLERMGLVRRDYAYHTTGSFANLLMDASNKTLLAAYEEAPYTWSLWARQATSVDDFKNINRIRFSESPDLEVVPENTEYPEGVMSDSKESYSISKFGKMFSVSWETVVNDDLDAISRIPAMHGAAARRTQNKKVYEVLTANALMGDGVALFGAHTSGTNTSGAAAAPSVTTLNTAFTAMRRQKGLNSDVTLNIVPRYLIVPVSYEATALELVNSISYNAANNNEGVKNIYGPGGPRNLTVIGEPVLDGASTTVWYLAADPSQIDTVELTFLSGEETPVLETEWDFKNDTYYNKIRQTFGVKAIDWRGLYRNAA